MNINKIKFNPINFALQKNTAKVKSSDQNNSNQINYFSKEYSDALTTLGLSCVTFSGNKTNKVIKDFNLKNSERFATTLLHKNYSEDEVEEIKRNLNANNFSLAQILCNDNDFPKKHIADILLYSKNANTRKQIQTYELIKKFDNSTNTKENSENSSSVEHLLHNFKELQKKENWHILFYVNNSNASLLEEMLSDENFPREEIDSILTKINQTNADFASRICKIKDFPKKQIPTIIRNLDSENIRIAELLCFDEEIPKDFIHQVLLKADWENADLIENFYYTLKSIKNFPQEAICPILNNINKINKALAQTLCEDENFPKKQISQVLSNTSKRNIEQKTNIYQDIKNIENFPKELISEIILCTNEKNYEYSKKVILECQKYDLTSFDISVLMNDYYKLNIDELIKLKNTVPKEVYEMLAQSFIYMRIGVKIATLYEKENINEISMQERKKLVKSLMQLNHKQYHFDDEIKKHFPLAPKNQEEYCKLLSNLVNSLGIKTKKLSKIEIKKFTKTLNKLSSSLKQMNDEEFNKIKIKQTYSKDDFIKDVLKEIKNLNETEQKKVFDYFGFELYENYLSEIGYSIIGYPKDSADFEKLSQIKDENTKNVIQNLKNNIINFSENNKIICNDKNIERQLNNIAKLMPEIHTMIDKKQHNTHSFDILKHSLKVIQKISQNEEFDGLNFENKKLLLLTALLHDICKKENEIDKLHPEESAFDSFYIAKKLNLSKDEEIKLYTLIKNHDWYEKANTAKEQDKTKTLQSIAFDFQYDNLFKLAQIFTIADLKAVKSNDFFFNRFSENLNNICSKIQNNIQELQKTKPFLPTTKIPKASEIKEKIQFVNDDYSTNIKGLYQDKNGLIIIKYNEVEDWSALGFDKNCISKGIESRDCYGKKINTGNIKFIAHGLDYPEHLINFEAFRLPDSEALLSVSYMERPESKYHLFRPQGVLLDVDTKYIHGGGQNDTGSGYLKNITDLKHEFYNGKWQKDRVFIANLIKETFNFNDEEYIEFLKENENKYLNEIKPKKTRNELIKAFATINSRKRRYDREYNEMYITNPKVNATFACSFENKIGKIKLFIEKQPDFLKKYSIEKDVPMIIFGG